MTMTLHLGDCKEVLETIEPKTIQTCVTSPPYYGLRDYGHAAQIGQEDTPEQYIARLVEVFRGVWRALKNDGTLWLNLGDSYAGSNQGAGTKIPTDIQASNRGTNYQTTEGHKSKLSRINGFKPKDLLMIPARVALALQADGWYLRSEIIWHKPNPMPESVKDRPTKSHEMIYLFAKSEKYFYDADAVREPYAESSLPRALRGVSENNKWSNGAQGSTAHTMSKARKNRRKEWKGSEGANGSGFKGHSGYYSEDGRLLVNPLGRNKRDVWTVTTKPYKGAHFATFPPDLIEPCILAGSKAGDIVLDPFNGAGTTGKVALKHGREYVGIDINPDYLKLTKARLVP